MDRSTRRGLIALAFAGTLAACSHAPSSVTAPHEAGTFALVGGNAAADAQMDVKRDGATRIDIVQTKAGESQPITAYAHDQTKLMHLVVVSEDFRSFAHVHPSFDASTGHFTQTLAVDPAKRYYVYADTMPKGMTQQVFRFVLQPASATASPSNAPAPSFTPSPRTTIAGPYTVALSTTSLKSAAPSAIDVAISRGGKPATDLQPYLGAAAHAIALNTATLEYAHVHPMLAGHAMSMTMEKPEAGPHLMMHLPALAVGSYKMWLQFRGGATVYTAPITLVVR